MNTLASDIARCPGIRTDEGWAEVCKDCLRRTAPRPEIVVLIAPPAISSYECGFLIEPHTPQ